MFEVNTNTLGRRAAKPFAFSLESLSRSGKGERDLLMVVESPLPLNVSIPYNSEDARHAYAHAIALR